MKMKKGIWVGVFIIQLSLFAVEPNTLDACHTNNVPALVEKRIAVVSTGLPGVGKSTILKELNRQMLGSIYLDKDVINEILLQGNEYFSEYYKKFVKNQSYELMFALAEDNLKNSSMCTVILDGMFGDKLSSPIVKPFIDSPNFTVKVIYFYCSPELNRQRLLDRADARDNDKLNDFENYYRQTIAIHQRELSNVSYLSINTESDVNENIKLIIEYLNN